VCVGRLNGEGHGEERGEEHGEERGEERGDAATPAITVWAGTQNPHVLRADLATLSG